jgi:thioredoxin reductase
LKNFTNVSGSYHCLFCDGFESRGAKSSGILASGELAVSYLALLSARNARRLTDTVTIYTNNSPSLAAEINQELNNHSTAGISVDDRLIASFSPAENGSKIDISLSDGRTITQEFLVHKPKTEITGPFARHLALELTEKGDVKCSLPFFETSVRGVFAVGDCAAAFKIVSTALYMGNVVGAAIAIQLQEEG